VAVDRARLAAATVGHGGGRGGVRPARAHAAGAVHAGGRFRGLAILAEVVATAGRMASPARRCRPCRRFASGRGGRAPGRDGHRPAASAERLDAREASLWPTTTVADPAPARGGNRLRLLSPPERLRRLDDARLVVVCVVRDERVLLPHFLAHHRALGATAFVLVDNLSSDGTREFLEAQPDVVLYLADTDYRDSHFGVAWQQAVLAAHAQGRWALLVDADELLLYPGCEHTPLPALLDRLDGAGHDAARTMMIDMYPRGPCARRTSHGRRRPPRRTGSTAPRSCAGTWAAGLLLHGHLAQRPAAPLIPHSPPNAFTAQKTALLRWRPWMRLSEGLHYVAGVRPAPEALFLGHYKYHAGFREKVLREVERQQHFDAARSTCTTCTSWRSRTRRSPTPPCPSHWTTAARCPDARRPPGDRRAPAARAPRALDASPRAPPGAPGARGLAAPGGAPSRARGRMRRSAAQLVPSRVREAAIAESWCLLVCCVRNELVRMPAFLAHYRRLGVAHFLVVDNQSTDGLADWLAQQPDCSCWLGDGSYKASNFGMDWCNELLARHGVWQVVPHRRSRRVPRLPALRGAGPARPRALHGGRGQPSLHAPMIDAYGGGRVSETGLASGQSPFEVCPYFDRFNFTQHFDAHRRNWWVQGGARMRRFNPAQPRLAPALNKVPLVRWERGLHYVSSMHHLNRPRYNCTVTGDPQAVSGSCSTSSTLTCCSARRARRCCAASTMPRAASTAPTSMPAIPCCTTRRSRSASAAPRQLAELGFMQAGGCTSARRPRPFPDHAHSTFPAPRHDRNPPPAEIRHRDAAAQRLVQPRVAPETARPTSSATASLQARRGGAPALHLGRWA
jgi:hypothetical protein